MSDHKGGNALPEMAREEHFLATKKSSVWVYDSANDRMVLVSSSNPLPVLGGKATSEYSISAISEDATYKYFWFEDASKNYYIMRKHLTNLVFTYTKGTGGYEAVYQSSSLGPSGSPTWDSYGDTF